MTNVAVDRFADSSASVSEDAGFPASDKNTSSAKLNKSLVPGYSVLAKCMVGSGLVNLASVLTHSGWVVGLVSCVVAALATFLSLHLIGTVAVHFKRLEENKTQPLSFLRMSSRLSPRLRPVVDIAIALKCLGAGSAYLVFVAELVYNLYEEVATSRSQLTHKSNTSDAAWSPKLIDSFLLSTGVMVGVVVLFAYLCFQKAVSNTKIFNIFGLLAMLYVVVLTMVYVDWSPALTNMWPTGTNEVLTKLPTFIFAFTCHQNLFGVIDDLEQPTPAKVSTISGLATLTGFLLFTICIVFPYGTFGSTVKGNFLLNYLASDDGHVDVAAFVACVAASVSVAISFPLQMLPLRRSLIALIYGSQGVPEHQERRVRLMLSTLVVCTTLGISVLANKFFKDALSQVMSITGLIGGNMLCFVFPSWLYIQAVHQQLVPTKNRSPLYVAACCLLAGSLALYPLYLLARLNLF